MLSKNTRSAGPVSSLTRCAELRVQCKAPWGCLGAEQCWSPGGVRGGCRQGWHSAARSPGFGTVLLCALEQVICADLL